jgi:hypothetical protein
MCGVGVEGIIKDEGKSHLVIERITVTFWIGLEDSKNKSSITQNDGLIFLQGVPKLLEIFPTRKFLSTCSEIFLLTKGTCSFRTSLKAMAAKFLHSS